MIRSRVHLAHQADKRRTSARRMTALATLRWVARSGIQRTTLGPGTLRMWFWA